MPNPTIKTAIFGGGCFWCTEAVFQELKGVEKVISGYAGGETKNPTYREICGGFTGHAEVIQVQYNPEEVDFETILQVHFATHDPTTLNRQGNDVGTQYRSIIFYENEEEKAIAEKVKKEFAPTLWTKPIVTEIQPMPEFYPAENYHQDFYQSNQSYPYCQIIINPKLAKFRKEFAEKLK